MGVKYIIPIIDDDEWFIELRYAHQDAIYGHGRGLPYMAYVYNKKSNVMWCEGYRLSADLIVDPLFTSYMEEILKDRYEKADNSKDLH